MYIATEEDLLSEIEDLKSRLSEAQEAIDAIKNGSVDAFAIRKDGTPEVFTLQSLDYAYRVLIEKFSEGALNLTLDGLIIYSNGYFSRLVDTPNEKVTGSYIFDYISAESRQKFREQFALALQGCSKTEITLRGKNKDVPVYVSLTNLQPQLSTVGMIVTDLSDKKQYEQLITGHTETLRKKNVELEHLNKSLDQFASIASHDLQEPLRKIKTFTALLKAQSNQTLSGESNKLIEKIRKSSERMSLLISDVLNFSRIVQIKDMFVKTDLNQILNNTLIDFDLLILEKDASVSIGDLPVVEAIPLQITQLFYNLVGNALKFTKTGKPAFLSISSRMLSPDETGNEFYSRFNLNSQFAYSEICFKDNGIGFEQQFSEQIFSIFERLHDQEQYSGTGIGLALCQKIAQQHHGGIRAQGKEGDGAAFYVLLPLTQSTNAVS
jgi:PAS domain S-box-containing protein